MNSATRTATHAAVLAIMLALAGCTEAAPTEPTAPARATPKESVGAATMTVEEAGERYLSIVCEANVAIDETSLASEVARTAYLNNEEVDVAPLTSGYARLLSLIELSAKEFANRDFIWPVEVATQIDTLRTGDIADFDHYQAIATATTYDEVLAAPEAQSTLEQDSAPQKIRFELGLSLDKEASCVGYENALTKLGEESGNLVYDE